MSFLSIAFLAALPLAAAPILLHLFDRRRNVVIEWGAMQFLMAAATRRTSARRLKQWLLLLMRVLAIAALVLSLARPMLPGNWFGRQERGETIVILDNSMSMMRTVGQSSLFATAIERAIATIDDIPPGDSVRVLLASPYPVWATAGSVRVDSGSRPLIVDQLHELRTTHGSSDLLSSLFTAVQADIEPMQRRRRVVLLTDGQGADWSTRDDNGWKRFREVLQSAGVPTQLDVVELDHAAQQSGNIAVNTIRASRTVVGRNQSCSLTAEIRNHGRTSTPPAAVTWSIAGKTEEALQLPELEGGQQHDVTWKHSFDETGVYAVSCEIDAGDELAPDNRATVVIEVVDQVPVLLLENAAELAEIQRDAFFVQAALGWIDGEPLDEPGVHVPSLVDFDGMERTDFGPYRAIVLPNLTELNEETVARLQEFVFNGGGLWIALGPRTDVDAFNQLLFADGDGLAPLAIDHIVDEDAARNTAGGKAQKTTINPFVKDHPATAELADSQKLDTGDITISRRFRFVPPPQGEEAAILLSLSNGDALAVEKYVGRGRVIVQSIPLRIQWSELARSQAFVVMVQDWLAYLTQPRATRHNLSPGDPISVHLAGPETSETNANRQTNAASDIATDTMPRDALLRTPQGDEIELTADTAGDGAVFRSSRTILPGDYLLELGLSGDAIPFHVQRDPEESNLAPLTTADHQLLADIAGLSHDASAATITATNQTDPLWPILLMLLIGLIAGELILSGIISRERFGGPAISETTEQQDTGIGAIPMSFGSKSTVSPLSSRELVHPPV